MRLGAHVFPADHDPGTWIAALQAEGYRAAYSPITKMTDSATIETYARAAAEADIVIAEVGAWQNNPISPDDAVRRAGIEGCSRQLALADELGARCCVNVAGSRGERWAGPHPDNLTPATFDLIVESVRQIIDAVKPRRSFYALELMPWIYPNSIETCEELLKAVDRRQFGVHFDPVNIITSPRLYYHNGAMMTEFVRTLGPHIKSCHIKDIQLRDELTFHLDEVRPGLGALEYPALLHALDTLAPDLPVMLEHLPTEDDYRQAAAHVRRVAGDLNIDLAGSGKVTV